MVKGCRIFACNGIQGSSEELFQSIASSTDINMRVTLPLKSKFYSIGSCTFGSSCRNAHLDDPDEIYNFASSAFIETHIYIYMTNGALYIGALYTRRYI